MTTCPLCGQPRESRRMTLIRRLSTSVCDWCVLLAFTQYVVKPHPLPPALR